MPWVMQVPKVHAWPMLHAMQVKPALPQACTLLPGWHAPVASQHPLQLDDVQGFVVGPPQAAKARTRPDSTPKANARIMSAQRTIFGRRWRDAGALRPCESFSSV